MISRAAGIKSLETALLQVRINSHYISVHESLYLRCEIVGEGILMGSLLVGGGQSTLTKSFTKAAQFGRGNIPECWKMVKELPYKNGN